MAHAETCEAELVEESKRRLYNAVDVEGRLDITLRNAPCSSAPSARHTSHPFCQTLFDKYRRIGYAVHR